MWPWSSADTGANGKSSNASYNTPAAISKSVGEPEREWRQDILKWLRQLREEKVAVISELDARAASLPSHLLALSAFAVGSVSTAASVCIYVRYFRRLPTAEWVTPDLLAKKRWVKGYVTSVGDPDNFRIYHTPAFGWRWPLKFRRVPTTGKELKDQTIHIRMAGVDAPEAGHFGRPAQPFAEEALAWLKSQVEGKTVYCQLVRRDQYGRIVAIPRLRPRLLPGFLATGKYVSEEMLRAGWAQTYEQAGAEYGPLVKADFLRIQAEAQAEKRGIWKYGTDVESPAEYKRRGAASDGKGVTGGAASAKNVAAKGGWFRRFLRASLR